MRNRELLELSAKAAGINLEGEGHPDEWQAIYYKGKTYHSWDPLADGADALWLANKLRMTIEHHPRWPYVAAFSGEDVGRIKTEEPYGEDVDAATRRAIVRAAAEIGRGA